ncbi:MAG: amino acid adenylation domain-containing protein, partial [Flavobacterium sp.]
MEQVGATIAEDLESKISTEQKLGKTVSFKTFFSNATVEKISRHLKDNNYSAIEKATNAESYSLTASQNRLWILSQLEGRSLAYNMPATVKLTGELDSKKFEESFALLIERHEILRTYFKTNPAGEVQQYVLPVEQMSFKILHEDFTLAENQEDEVRNYLNERNNETFDLEKAPLLRASLLKLKNKEYVFFLSLHHIIGDGWSMELLISEVIKTYNALIQGKNIDFPVLKIQYKDYAVWLNNAIQQEKQQESGKYWLEQFSGELPILNLPSFKTRPRVQTHNGEQRRYEFSETFLEQLKAFSIQQDVTLFMTLMAGINTLLYKYTGQEDIILGTPTAGREHPDLENQLGLYVNTLAIRTKFEGNNSFADLVVNQKETLLEAFEHQNYPFDALVGKLDLKRDISRSALFDVMVILQSQGQLNNLEKEELSNLVVSEYEFKSKTSKLDLSFTFIENEGLSLVIDYNLDIYDAYLIERMFAHFENLITAVVAKPETALHAIEYLTIAEEHQLLKTFSDTAVNYPTGKTIIDLFEEQVARTPHNIAVVFEDKVLTYNQLNEQANQLGHYIRENNNVQPDDLIGIKLERSEKMIISIFAVLKSGGAYVPIDPGYPQERIEYIEKDSNSKFVIDEEELELFYKQQDHYSKLNPKKINSPENLAYVIYTSGTTGNPKGTLLEHKNVVRLFFTDKSLFDFDENDVWTMFHSYAFDFSVWEINGALLFGGKLVVVPKIIAQNTPAFLELLYDQSVTILNQTPSSFYNLIQYQKIEAGKDYKLRYVIFGGEALNPSLLADWHKRYPNTRLINMYGITETTVHVTYKEIGANEIASEQSNIGKPIPTLGCYILDPNKNIVSIGVFGELYITGSGLARGYLNRPDLTSEKFIPSPFAQGELMYKTGDLGRWLPNGDIEYIGRIDHQVKIRGFRIELGEIETAIAQYSETIEKVVVEAKEINQEKVLIAYLVANSAINKTELRYYLQSKLPEYMIPVFYIELEAIPLTSNGKVDRKALPVIKGEDLLQKEYIAPRNATEQKLVEIWKEVLGIDQIGITDNFFELGGHSLLLGQVINRIHKQLEQTVSFKTFFISPTIEGLSKQLQKNIYSAIEQAPESQFYPLTPSQNRLWVLSQLEGGETIYNMPAAVKLKGIIDIVRFNQAFIQLIARHEILRTSFRANKDGEVSQFIVGIDEVKFKIKEKDFSATTDIEQRIADYLEEKNNEIFDLEQAPLIKASLIKFDQHEHLFFLSLHHIIGDGWSIEVLIAEVTRIYNGLMQGKEINLPALNIQYKDYAVWLNDHLQQEKYQKSAQYWLQQFEGELPVLNLPSFKKRPLIQTHNGNNITHQFSSDFLEKLKTFSKEQDVTLFMTLMTGINALLYLYTGQNDIIVGTPIAGREHPDLENQIGLYLNTLAIRTVLEEDTNFTDLLKKQKEVLVEAFEHQNYPFDELIGKLNLKRDSSRSALFDVLVVLQNQTQLKNFEAVELSSLEVHNYKFLRKSSQFDLSFTFVETTGLDLKIEYNTDIYDIHLIERMFLHFEKLLVASIAQPDVLIQKAVYLNEDEKQKILVDFNDTKVIYPSQKTIVDLFEEQVAKTPYNNAVLFEEIVLTYTDLNEKANRLAYYLRENYSIKSEDLVGIKLDRSERMIVAVLGVLKSGAAYIPIDVNYPQERIAYIEKDSNSKIIIDETIFETFIEIQEKYSGNNIKKNNEPTSLAYVIYTSGTTGNPKGVMVEHTNVINLISHQSFVFGIEQTENILQFSNLSFDASVEQIFLALLNGASLSIPNNETLLNGKKLEEFITAQNITHLHAVPSLLENIEPQKFPFLKRVISGGDICPVELADSWSIYCDFYNEYGPTETTVTAIELLYNEQEDFSIGRPISNNQVYIINQALEPVAIGVTGKIFISGAGVTRGYLNKPELTTDKFIANPYIKDSLMY